MKELVRHKNLEETSWCFGVEFLNWTKNFLVKLKAMSYVISYTTGTLQKKCVYGWRNDKASKFAIFSQY